jgi:DHA1 family inner membrane transport protein
VIIYVLLLCSFAVATTEFVLVGLLPDIATELSVSLPSAGLLVTAYMIVVAVGGPVAAIATRRVPRRPLLIAVMTLALGSAGLSTVAGSYGVLLGARMGSALAQALFMSVASQVAMASVPPERQTAAVAKLFNGFALATVIGLPAGTLVGEAYGWHAAFGLVMALSAAGLAGVIAFVPPLPAPPADDLRRNVAAVIKPSVLVGLAVTGLAFTGFVAAFTYVSPTLHDVTGLGPTWVGAVLVIYGIGTLAGNLIAGRVRPGSITRLLPLPLVALTIVLAVGGVLAEHPATAVVSVFALGASAFIVAPLIQTWLMAEVGQTAAGLIATLNISVSGLAAAVGASLGGAVISAGWGLAAIGPAAAVPALAATLLAGGLRVRTRTSTETATQTRRGTDAARGARSTCPG